MRLPAHVQRCLCEQVVVELAVACTSAGDAFRSLDQKDLVKNTFVLVSGDVVTNMDLAAAYREHRDRRQASPAAILTLARLQPCCKMSRLRDNSADAVARMQAAALPWACGLCCEQCTVTNVPYSWRAYSHVRVEASASLAGHLLHISAQPSWK